MFMLPAAVAIAVILMPSVSNGQFYSESLPQRGPWIVTAAAAAAAAAAVPNGVTSRESSTTATVASGENKLFWNWTMSQRSPPSSTTDDEGLLPTLANGHLGFTVFGDAIYMNGLYNGHRGLSHRARIANIANIRLGGTGRPFEDGFSGGNQSSSPPWTMDFETGTFCVDYRGPNNSFRVVQLIYPHQLYNRAIVNQFTIERLDGEGDIHIGIIQSITLPGSEDIAFNPTKTIFISPDAEPTAMNFGNEYSVKVYQTCGTTVELEDPDHQHQQRHVCVLWNHVPEELTLKRSERTVSYKFIMTADESASLARQELTEAIFTEDNELLRRHSNVWRGFWSDFDIRTEGNPTLERIIRASVFYLISNFPLAMASSSSSARAYLFGGLSPTGLGRGGSNLADYEGHSFWDTEIWMFPVVNLIESKFAEMMVDYRFRRMVAARRNAEEGGYRGVKYPWESASSGVEVTQPCCPEVAQFQHHITADISFALRQYFSATQDLAWLANQGCPMAQAIAEFWASRISPDPVTGLFDIKGVMGPDEDHENVTNNAYTNVVAAYALYFGDLTKCLCSKHDDDNNNGADSGNKTNPMGRDKDVAPLNSTGGSGNWTALARHVKLLYDTENDYHPQFEGYQLGTAIKQADTVLLGYPLQYSGMDADTRRNDLRFYESVTRRSGPAMTWAMHAINYLDLGDRVKGLANFDRSYKTYVREPFYVWNEVDRGSGNGATNFITGAGGFLQAVINGFGGVRLFLDRMEIGNSKLPPESTKLEVKGLQYLGAKFTLTVSRDMTSVKFTKLSRELTLCIGSFSCESVMWNQTYNITNMTMVIQAKKNVYTHCTIPEDVINTVYVNSELYQKA